MTSHGKYADLIDAETWDFIERTNAWYPPDAVDHSIEKQREVYDAMCREFFSGYPDGVEATDRLIDAGDHAIPCRDYAMAGTVPAARVIYYHGGGFVVGGLESHDDVCAELCARTRYPVTSVDYRMSPEHIYPADFEDARTAFLHIAGRGDHPVILVGDSAGGNLAATVSQAVRGGGPQPAGQVLIYPGLGSDTTKGTFIEHADAPMLTTRDIAFYKTLRTGGNEKLLEEPTCTPLRDTDFSKLPPTLIFSAECDPLAGDGGIYCDHLLTAGGKAIWFNEKGMVHGYLRARHSVGRARASFSRIVEAIDTLGRGDWPYTE